MTLKISSDVVTLVGSHSSDHRSPVEVFGLCPARLTITFLSLADVRPVPRPVVPSGKRSFGSRSAVLTAKHPPKPIYGAAGINVQVVFRSVCATKDLTEPARAPSPLVALSRLPSPPFPPISAVPSLSNPVPQPLLAPLSLRTVNWEHLCDQSSPVALDERTSLSGLVTASSWLMFDLLKVSRE